MSFQTHLTVSRQDEDYLDPVLVRDYAYRVFDCKRGVIIFGRLPVEHFSAIGRLAGSEDAVVVPGLCNYYGATSVVARSQQDADEWEAEIENRLAPLGKLDAWVQGTDTGRSSLTIYHAIHRKTRYVNAIRPADWSDFGRCHRLLQIMPEWRSRLNEVADVCPEWKELVAVWGELEELYAAGELYVLSDHSELDRRLKAIIDADHTV